MAAPLLTALRFIAFEDLGSLAKVATDRGLTIRYVEAAELPEVAPDWMAPSPMVVLGGPIGVADRDRYPCLSLIIDGLRMRLRAGLPTLGICLGAQLIAHALGARVRATGSSHIGWWPLQLMDDGDQHAMAALRGRPVLHWHGDTFDCPEGAVPLAATDAIACQAFTLVDAPVLALQCHIECEASGFERWLIGHAFELQHNGIDIAALRAAGERHGPVLAEASGNIFGDWLQRAGHGAQT